MAQRFNSIDDDATDAADATDATDATNVVDSIEADDYQVDEPVETGACTSLTRGRGVKRPRSPPLPPFAPPFAPPPSPLFQKSSQSES